jgi:tRNA-dihydrouridine synthase B
MSNLKIGPHVLPSRVILAPMAGVTDRPFRMLCRQFGAGLAASEMLTSDTRLWDTDKSQRRMDFTGEPSPRVVQIAGYDAGMMAEAAQRNVDAGADIIDINMGCPAKKVCNRQAGSALLRDESLVAQILERVVRAVAVPVTLKTRTGWDREHKNGIRIATLAEQSGIQAMAARAPTCIRAMRSTRPCGQSSRACVFRYSPTAILIRRSARKPCSKQRVATES